MGLEEVRTLNSLSHAATSSSMLIDYGRAVSGVGPSAVKTY